MHLNKDLIVQSHFELPIRWPVVVIGAFAIQKLEYRFPITKHNHCYATDFERVNCTILISPLLKPATSICIGFIVEKFIIISLRIYSLYVYTLQWDQVDITFELS